MSCVFIPGEGPGWQMMPDAAGGEGGHGVAKPDAVIHRMASVKMCSKRLGSNST